MRVPALPGPSACRGVTPRRRVENHQSSISHQPSRRSVCPSVSDGRTWGARPALDRCQPLANWGQLHSLTELGRLHLGCRAPGDAPPSAALPSPSSLQCFSSSRRCPRRPPSHLVGPSLFQESWVSPFPSQIRGGAAYKVTSAYHARSTLPTCTLTSHMVDHHWPPGSGHHAVASHTRRSCGTDRASQDSSPPHIVPLSHRITALPGVWAKLAVVSLFAKRLIVIWNCPAGPDTDGNGGLPLRPCLLAFTTSVAWRPRADAGRCLSAHRAPC